MIVKIGNRFYDSGKEPILLILGDFEKEHLANMGDNQKYCSFPEDADLENIKKFIDVPQAILDMVSYN